MTTAQKGFTLVELVVVIVILGILVATALPKFVDLSTEAGNAAASGVAAALASGSSINYAARAAGKSPTVAVTSATSCNETVAAALVQGVTFVTTTPATGNEYKMGGTGDCSGGSAAGTAVTCTVLGFKGVAQNATLICSG